MRFIAEIAAAYGYFFTERHEEAAAAAQRAININPGFVPALALVVASLTRAGKKEAAGAATGHLLKVKPNFQIGEFIRVGRFTAELNEKFAAALRDSQLPG